VTNSVSGVTTLKHDFRKNLNAALLLVMAIGSVESVADSNHYRWINSRGEPVYSDRPPPKGVDYEVISTQSTLKRVVSGDEGAVPLEVNPSASNDFDPVDSAEEGRSKKNSALCERAKMNLVALEAPRKATVRNDQGEQRELSPQEREVAKQTAKAQIDAYCD